MGLQSETSRLNADCYLRSSGYPNFDHPITLATPFSEDRVSGHAFAPRRIVKVVPGRVYTLTGLEFTEYYFVISKDRHHLISIDAGPRPDFAKGAYEALQAYAPGLPPLTTVFITHAHWDHVGGHSYFRSLSSRPKLYGRANYQEEFAREFNGPDVFGKEFFSERFNTEDVRSYKPDIAIDKRTDLNIGGTKFELIRRCVPALLHFAGACDRQTLRSKRRVLAGKPPGTGSSQPDRSRGTPR
jgi:ribonuclease BN (tRNA processing enzyme)